MLYLTQRFKLGPLICKRLTACGQPAALDLIWAELSFAWLLWGIVNHEGWWPWLPGALVSDTRRLSILDFESSLLLWYKGLVATADEYFSAIERLLLQCGSWFGSTGVVHSITASVQQPVWFETLKNPTSHRNTDLDSAGFLYTIYTYAGSLCLLHI